MWLLRIFACIKKYIRKLLRAIKERSDTVISPFPLMLLRAIKERSDTVIACPILKAN